MINEIMLMLDLLIIGGSAAVPICSMQSIVSKSRILDFVDSVKPNTKSGQQQIK